jgi:hypothetical protein
MSQRLAAFGYNGPAAEVIAAQFYSGSDVLCGWQESGGHNSQLLNDDWTVLGIGRGVRYAPGGNYIQDIFWAVDFGIGPGSQVQTPNVPHPEPYCPYSGYTPTPPGQTPPPTTPNTPTPTPTATPTGQTPGPTSPAGATTPAETATPTDTPTPTPSPSPSPSPTPDGPPAFRWDDFDCSGGVDPGDSKRLLEFTAGVPAPSEQACLQVGNSVWVNGARRTWGDTDCNLQPTIIDSIKLLQYLLGLGTGSLDPTCPAPGTGIWLPATDTPTPEVTETPGGETETPTPVPDTGTPTPGP